MAVAQVKGTELGNQHVGDYAEVRTSVDNQPTYVVGVLQVVSHHIDARGDRAVSIKLGLNGDESVVLAVGARSVVTVGDDIQEILRFAVSEMAE